MYLFLFLHVEVSFWDCAKAELASKLKGKPRESKNKGLERKDEKLFYVP